MLDTATAAVQPGQIFVADPEAGPGGKGAILRVDRASGAQTVVSTGGQFQNPVGVAIGGQDELFVADADASGAPERCSPSIPPPASSGSWRAEGSSRSPPESPPTGS